VRRELILITGLVLLVFLSACGREDGQDIFGEYKFKEVSYLSPLSSATKDSVNRRMKGSEYTIKEDLFKIVESTGYTVEYSSPKYVQEEIDEEATLFSDVFTFLGRNVDYQYAVYDEYENKTTWRLYVSSNSLWIGKCNKAPNGSDIVMYIYKLSK